MGVLSLLWFLILCGFGVTAISSTTTDPNERGHDFQRSVKMLPFGHQPEARPIDLVKYIAIGNRTEHSKIQSHIATLDFGPSSLGDRIYKHERAGGVIRRDGLIDDPDIRASKSKRQARVMKCGKWFPYQRRASARSLDFGNTFAWILDNKVKRYIYDLRIGFCLKPERPATSASIPLLLITLRLALPTLRYGSSAFWDALWRSRVT
jgi:hypothetical protein